MSDIHRIRRRYLLASIGILAAVGASFTMGHSGVDSAAVPALFAVALVCAEVIRRTAVQIERANSDGHGRSTWVRRLQEGDVLEDHKGLGPVTAVRHRGLVSHVFTENVGLVYYAYERPRVLAARGE